MHNSGNPERMKALWFSNRVTHLQNTLNDKKETKKLPCQDALKRASSL
jgi:hypothetical protein